MLNCQMALVVTSTSQHRGNSIGIGMRDRNESAATTPICLGCDQLYVGNKGHKRVHV